VLLLQHNCHSAIGASAKGLMLAFSQLVIALQLERRLVRTLCQISSQTWRGAGYVRRSPPCLLVRGTLGLPGRASPTWLRQGAVTASMPRAWLQHHADPCHQVSTAAHFGRV
jgi:hypothetical protein